ncbi:hypothetical protein T484DRAFT_1890512, partial [Baffinella frigidus]
GGSEACAALNQALSQTQALLESRTLEVARLSQAFEEKRRECNQARRERAPWGTRLSLTSDHGSLAGGAGGAGGGKGTDELLRALRAAEKLAEERTAQVRAFESVLGKDREGQWEQKHHSAPWDLGATISDEPRVLHLPDYPEYGDPITSSTPGVVAPPRVESPPPVRNGAASEGKEKSEDGEEPAEKRPGFWLDSEGWVGETPPDASEGQGLFGGWGRELKRWSGGGGGGAPVPAKGLLGRGGAPRVST